MRLVGLALMFMLLVGLAQVVLDRFDVIERFLARSDDHAPIELVFETPTALHYTSDLVGAWIEEIAPVKQSQFRSMQKFPDFARFEFRLPQSVKVHYAALSLDLETRLLDTSSGVVNIRINGRKRGDILLEPGERSYRVRIPLERSDLDEPLVQVALHTFGQSMKMACSVDEGMGVLVEVLPTTHLEAALDGDGFDFADELARAGDPARIVWPEGGDRVIQGDVLNLAHNLMAEQVADLTFVAETVFGPHDIRLDDARIDTASRLIEPRAGDALLVADAQGEGHWPVRVLQGEQDVKVRKFTNEQNWNFDYRHSDMPGGRLPGTLDFELDLAGASEGEKYLVYVTLNGALIHAENLPHSAQTVARSVDLPKEHQRFHNEVSISVARSEVRSQPCNAGLPVVAQLKPGTALWPGFDTSADAGGELLSLIKRSARVEVALAATMDAGAANRALEMLRDTLGPRMTDLTYNADTQNTITISVTSAGDLMQNYHGISHRSVQPIWVIWHNDRGTTVARADASRTAKMLRGDGDRVVLVVRSEGHGL